MEEVGEEGPEDREEEEVAEEGMTSGEKEEEEEASENTHWGSV
jgi:hypothetical protein